MSDPESNWLFIEDEIARLLEEISRKGATGIPQDGRPSKTYRWLRAAPRLVRSLAHSLTQAVGTDRWALHACASNRTRHSLDRVPGVSSSGCVDRVRAPKPHLERRTVLTLPLLPPPQ